MIAKSDLLILTLATAALAVGVYRWQAGTGAPVVATAPAPTVERLDDAPSAAARSASASASSGTAVPLAGNVARSGPEGGDATDEGPIVVRRVSGANAPERAAADEGDGGTTGVVATAVPSDPGAAPADPFANAGAGSGDGERGGEPLYGRHLVENGDYLGLLAERFGTSVATLQSINGLAGTTILIGDELLYPLPAN